MGFVYKRFRRSSKKQRDETKFAIAEEVIAELLSDADLEVAYFDESGFSLKGVVSYGWQPIGQRMDVPVTGAHRQFIQVLGIERSDGSLRSYPHRGRVTAKTVDDVWDDFAENIQQLTVLILDNASTHTSGMISQRFERWAQAGLFVYFLQNVTESL